MIEAAGSRELGQALAAHTPIPPSSVVTFQITVANFQRVAETQISARLRIVPEVICAYAYPLLPFLVRDRGQVTRAF